MLTSVLHSAPGGLVFAYPVTTFRVFAHSAIMIASVCHGMAVPLVSEGVGGLQAAPPGGLPRQPGIRSRMVKC